MAASDGVTLRVWDFKGLPPRHKSGLTMLRFLPTGEALLSGDGKTFHLWRAPSWAEIEAVEKTAERNTR